MHAGIWLSARAAAHYSQNEDAMRELQFVLRDSGIDLKTLNGFPYGSFHKNVVKADVYTPGWQTVERLSYTCRLAEILVSSLPEQADSGTISTLPLGYSQHWGDLEQQQAEKNIRDLLVFLDRIAQRTGKKILVCIEMEPGCVLESTRQVLQFFSDTVQRMPGSEYLGVCYDVCHQAVMFEDSFDSLTQLAGAGIPIGKIQISNALEVGFADIKRATDLLHRYAEPKYLHQVRSLDSSGKLLESSDLELALHGGIPTVDDWRIHFHVPLHRESLHDSSLKTTQCEVGGVFEFLSRHPEIRPDLEVETYSWHVLPEAYRPMNDDELIAGLCEELFWVESMLDSHGLLLRDQGLQKL